MNRKDVIHAIVKKKGPNKQISQTIEELCELAVALNHFRRGKCDKQRVLDEYADVSLMLEQIKFIFGFEQVDIDCQIDKSLFELTREAELDEKETP